MKEKIKTGNKFIGKNEPCFIIAEAGSNHDGKMEQAKRLIDVAAQSGADAVKFQLFKAEVLCGPGHPAFDIVKKNEFPRQWLKELNDHAVKNGIIFLAAPFDKEAVDLLCDIDVVALKLASSEVTNLPLLRYAAAKKKPVIISTAMSNLADIYEALETIYSTGNDDVVLLQCTALYPTDPHQVNLRAMDTLRGSFHLPVGFSDHTLGVLIPPVAVACGACVIEKHFTIDRKLQGPDHGYALEPDELAQMIRNIRSVEQSLGLPVKKMLPEEKLLARRESLFAKKDITKNAPITEGMFEIRRSALGVEARFLRVFVGRKAKRDIKKDEPVSWADYDI